MNDSAWTRDRGREPGAALHEAALPVQAATGRIVVRLVHGEAPVRAESERVCAGVVLSGGYPESRERPVVIARAVHLVWRQRDAQRAVLRRITGDVLSDLALGPGCAAGRERRCSLRRGVALEPDDLVDDVLRREIGEERLRAVPAGLRHRLDLPGIKRRHLATDLADMSHGRGVVGGERATGVLRGADGRLAEDLLCRGREGVKALGRREQRIDSGPQRRAERVGRCRGQVHRPGKWSLSRPKTLPSFISVTPSVVLPPSGTGVRRALGMRRSGCARIRRRGCACP